MINCRARPEKLKKKIAELLAAALKEEDEFAAKYAPIVRKRVQANHPAESASIAEQKKVEVKIFDENSEEFSAAVKKISPEILQLVRDQFKCAPSALLRGAFNEEEPAAKSAPSEVQEASIEDIQTVDAMEEDSD